MVKLQPPSRKQAWWAHRQGLDGWLEGAQPGEVLERTGWARSVGGASPYLTLHARAGTTRAAADQAVADIAIHECPSARGCTYYVPPAHYALALKVSQGFADEAEMKTARKLGVADDEVAKLSKGVTEALAEGPLDPDELKKRTEGQWRSLGPEGVKKGVTTTLPLALGFLQTSGKIRRIPLNGRLDGQRYQYALWKKNPFTGFKLSKEEAYTELARQFFGWTGGASVAEFQWFSGLGVKAAKAAMEPLKLVPWEDDRFMLESHRHAWEDFKAPKDPQYVLVSSLDGLVLLRRDLPSLLGTVDRVAGLSDLPSHAIVDRGLIVGLWEYDPDAQQIAWMAFDGRNSEMEAAVRRTEAFVRDELSDARSFSLDSPKSRAPRIAALRAAK